MEFDKHQTLFQILQSITKTLLGRSIYNDWPHEESTMQTKFEAETLLLYATGMTRVHLLSSMSENIEDTHVRNRLSEAVKSRLEGMPLAYIVSQANFYGRDFAVRPGCLIPRPETEILVEEAVRWIKSQNQHARVYDLGAGSGAISITVSLECAKAVVEAVDISPDALAVAMGNAKKLGANVSFHLADGLKDIADRAVRKSNRIHVLLSNPPYIPTEDLIHLEPDVRDYEPSLALDGGEDGLLYYKTLLSIGDGLFIPDEPAAIFFEVGIGQAQVLLSMLHSGNFPLWKNWRFGVKNDLRQVPRVVFGERIPE